MDDYPQPEEITPTMAVEAAVAIMDYLLEDGKANDTLDTILTAGGAIAHAATADDIARIAETVPGLTPEDVADQQSIAVETIVKVGTGKSPTEAELEITRRFMGRLADLFEADSATATSGTS